MDKEQKIPEETQVSENKKISINYVLSRDIWNRNNVIIDNINAFTSTLEITKSDKDPKPQIME